MNSNKLKQLKSDIIEFANGKYAMLDRVSLGDYLSKLDMYIDNEEKKEQHQYYVSLFRRKPYLKLETLINYHNEMLHIENTIHQALIEHPNFDGIDFVDVSSGGVYIRGFHKQNQGYAYGSQIKIDYEFNNYLNATRQFIEMWKEIDSPERVKIYNDFLDKGNVYGWE